MPDLSFAVVDPPALTPPRVGLLASAEEISDDARWTAGLAFDPFACGTQGGYFTACDADGAEDYGSKAFDGESRLVEYHPFVAWYGDSCSAATFGSRDFAGRAAAAYVAAESALLAQELWEGNVAQAAGFPNAYLASSDADVLPGVWPAVNGLGVLQAALAEAIPGRGMIHAPRDVAGLWYLAGAVRREGALLLDAFDNIVVADSGYTGVGPDGEARTDTTAFVYATDQVKVRRDGQVRVLPDPGAFSAALDRDTNLIEWRAERIVAAYWSGCAHLAIEVDTCSTECPSGS